MHSFPRSNLVKCFSGGYDKYQKVIIIRPTLYTNRYLSILPALAFSLDMFEKTNQSFGVNEVLLASVLGAVVFSVFAAQPLVIVGVTGESSSLLGAIKQLIRC